METEKAFISVANYLTKTRLPFGVGVVASFSEIDAINQTSRRSQFATFNEWYDIEIPSRKTFMQFDLPLDKIPEETLEGLFSEDAIQMLFYDEGQKLFRCDIPELIERNAVPEAEREKFSKEYTQRFRDKKIDELRDLGTVYALTEYITNRAKGKDIIITSSFLAKFGINGITYMFEDSERALVFDAKNKISLVKLNSDRINRSQLLDD